MFRRFFFFLFCSKKAMVLSNNKVDKLRGTYHKFVIILTCHNTIQPTHSVQTNNYATISLLLYMPNNFLDYLYSATAQDIYISKHPLCRIYKYTCNLNQNHSDFLTLTTPGSKHQTVITPPAPNTRTIIRHSLRDLGVSCRRPPLYKPPRVRA